MIANLIRKDFLLVRKNIAYIFGLLVLMSFLIEILSRDSERTYNIGSFAFLYMASLADLSFMQTVAAIEEKSSKATALLCAAPYPRRSYVIAKFISYLFFCVGCIVVYSFTALILPRLNFLNLTDALLSLLVGVILYGMYAPITIKVGAVNARFVVFFAILFIAFAPTVLVQLFHLDMNSVFLLLQNLPAETPSILLGAGILVFLLSMIISVRIFEKKEL